MARVLIGNIAAKHQSSSGTAPATSAPYVRCRSYCESIIYGGLMWLDLVHGLVDPADRGTKQIRDTAEFLIKDQI